MSGQMTVGELIEHLKQFNPELLVIYSCYSDEVLMNKDQVLEVTRQGPPRIDGYVGERRPDKPTQQYVTFPGN